MQALMHDLVTEGRHDAVDAVAVIGQRRQNAAIQHFLALLDEEPSDIGHRFFEIDLRTAE